MLTASIMYNFYRLYGPSIILCIIEESTLFTHIWIYIKKAENHVNKKKKNAYADDTSNKVKKHTHMLKSDL